jgi:hypothetical protein
LKIVSYKTYYMKKTVLFFTMCLCVTSFSTLAQIKVSSTGKVGINNTSPTYQLDVSGNFRVLANSNAISFDGSRLYPLTGSIFLGDYSYLWAQVWSTYAYFTYSPIILSDANAKTNIANLSGIKDRFMQLRPVTYSFKTDFENTSSDKTKILTQYGFIAQELQEVFPDIVTTREDGLLGVRYTELIPVLVQALKEQQEEIDALTKRISELEKAGQ